MAFKLAVKKLDQAVAKGVMHKKTQHRERNLSLQASLRKSRSFA
ncbi:MAG: hypothetical protein L6V93_20300 [Clostridiales bacterium]|nr:MAG: hypothetical protein L6V93_20300 [Clostridiales bacterium]